MLQVLAWNTIEALLLSLVVVLFTRRCRIHAPLRHALWLIVLFRLLAPPLGIHSYSLGTCCATLWESASAYAKQRATIYGFAHEQHTNSDLCGLATLSVDWPGASSTPEMEQTSDLGDRVELFSSIDPSTFIDSQQSNSNSARNVPETSIHAAPSVGSQGAGRPAQLESFLPRIAHWFKPASWPVVLLLGWLVGSICWLAYRVVQGYSLLRLLKQGDSAPLSVQAECRELSRQIGVRCAPTIRIVQGPVSPAVCVIGRCTIVLPARLLNESDPHIVRTVLAHELGHLKRRDHWICWFELIGSLAHWWNPVFWLVCRQVRLAADEAADAYAVSVIGGRQRYAESLLETLEILVAERATAAAWGPALGERDTIARRLTMIMKGPLKPRLDWPGWLGIAIIGLLTLPAAPLSLSAQEEKPVPRPPVESTDTTAGIGLQFVSEVAVTSEPQEPPRAVGAPFAPRRPETPGAPYPPGPPSRGGPDGPRDAHDSERRLVELEHKVDQILQMLQGMQRGPMGFQGGAAPGGMMMGGPGGRGGGMGFGGGPPHGAAPQPGTGPAMTPPGAPGAPGIPGAPSIPGVPGASPQPAQPGYGTGTSVPPPPTPPSGFGGGDGRPTPGGAGMSGAGMFGARQRQVDPFRGIDLTTEQRERLEAMERELNAERQKLEAEQARFMAELQRRRVEIENRMMEMRRELLTPEQRERLERRDGDRGRDAPEFRRRGGDRPRDGGGDRREPSADRRPNEEGSSGSSTVRP